MSNCEPFRGINLERFRISENTKSAIFIDLPLLPRIEGHYPCTIPDFTQIRGTIVLAASIAVTLVYL